MLTLCNMIVWVNLLLPVFVILTIPLNAWIDAKYGKKLTKDFSSAYKAFLVVCLWEGIIYIAGYASGFLLGACL